LIHGYMTDAQDLIKNDKKYESLRLELLQTLATLPIPNKTMLQDSKVLPTVEKWSVKGAELDSEVSSPQTDQEPSQTPTDEEKKDGNMEVESSTKSESDEMNNEEDMEIRKSVGMDYQGQVENSSFANPHGKELADEISGSFQEDM